LWCPKPFIKRLPWRWPLPGEVVNVRVVEQGFLLESNDNEIDDLIVSLRPATNGILVKLNMEQILHSHLNSGTY
jgi:hypothetical protein